MRLKQTQNTKTIKVRHASELNVGDEVLYDKFHGKRAAIPGVVTEITTTRGVNHVWVDCAGITYVCSVSRLLRSYKY